MEKILIADFDGTIFTTKENLKKNTQYISNFIENGNIFILATGRSLHLLDDFKDFMKLDFSYLICNDGGAIYDNKLNLIKSINLDYKVTKEIFNYLNKTNNFKNIILDDNKMFHYNKMISTSTFLGAEIIDKKDALDSLEYLKANYSKDVFVYLSKEWLNVLDIKANKANAINFLINLNNYSKSDIYVIGDAINDFRMIKEFNGYGISSGSTLIKSVSKKIYDEVYILINDIEKGII